MRASDSSVRAGQTSRFRQTQQLHKNEIGLDDIVVQPCNLEEHYKHEKYQSSGSCNRSSSFFDALHFLFLGLDGGTLLNGSHTEDTCIQRFVQPAHFNPTRIIALRSIDFFVTFITIVPDELFQSKQVNRQAFVVDLFGIVKNQRCKETFSICEPDVPHCCRNRFLPLAIIELSSHVDDGSSSSQSMFNSVGQCVSFSHQCTDSRRTPTQIVDGHLLSVQSVTRCQSCDTSLL